jgi:hypothetical protein
MLKLKIISFFLALVMAVQMLPLAQIGNALGANQWNEELPHNAGDEKGKTDGEDIFIKHYLSPGSHNFVASLLNNKTQIYIHTSEVTPSNHSTDVVTPPPDVVA